MSKIVLFADTDRHLHDLASELALTLSGQGNEVVLISPPGEYVDVLQALGLAWTPCAPLPPDRWAGHATATALGLASQLRREAPDLVHSFTTRGVRYGSMAARMAGVPARISTLTGVARVMGNAGRASRRSTSLRHTALRLALGGSGGRVIVHDVADVDWLQAWGGVDMACVRHISSETMAVASMAANPYARAVREEQDAPVTG